jgi:hypothetical protein
LLAPQESLKRALREPYEFATGLEVKDDGGYIRWLNKVELRERREVYVHIYIYTYIYIHTYMHTYVIFEIIYLCMYVYTYAAVRAELLKEEERRRRETEQAIAQGMWYMRTHIYSRRYRED